MASGESTHVITVLQVLEATEGGTRRHLRDLVSALDPQAFRAVLAVSCGREAAFLTDDVPGYAARGVPVHEVPMRRGIAPASDLLSLAQLVRVIRCVRPDVVHAHSAKAGFLARLAGAVCRVPVVYTPHAFPFLMTCRPRARRLYRLLERCVRGATAALIAVSEEEAGEARRLGYAGERVFLIRNGASDCEAGEVAVREAGVLHVGFFGRLTRQKGPDVLLEAVADVVAHLPHTRFSFTGDGEMAEPLRVRAEALGVSACVTFAGACSQGETVKRMRETDVVVVPSRWEGCPYVVLEAFQAGVPLVASAVGGVPDLVQNGVNGVLVAAEDAEALVDALLGLLREPRKRRRLAEQGRVTAGLCGLDAMAAAVGRVYRQVARAR